MDQGQYYPGQPLPVAYGIPSGLPSAKSEEDRLREEVARLKSENAEHPDIAVPELSELVIWGVATFSIHHLRRP